MKFLTFFFSRLKAFKNFEAWFMIIVGLVAYTARIPLPSDGLLHLPLAVTVIQVGGLMFMLAGVQIFLSLLMWPNVRLKHLLELAERGNNAAGTAAFGLMAFNGLSLLAQVLWLIYGTGARVGM